MLIVDRPAKSNAHIDLEDVTKVKSHGTFIDQIGKELQDYNFYDTGLFVARPSIFEALEECIAQGGESISNMVQLMASRQRAFVQEVSDCFWNDVDTPTDLKYMREQF